MRRLTLTSIANFFLVLSVLVTTSVKAFSASSMKRTTTNTDYNIRSTIILHMSDNNDDPTKVWYAKIADVVQNLLTNSPLNEGKKALVRSLAGDYDKAETRAKLESLISNEKVFMLSFVKWPFCVKAKAILDNDYESLKYTVIEVDEADDGKALRAEMADLIDRTSVPAIWIGGTFIGGCNDGPLGGINTLKKNGELTKMLKAAGAI